MPEQKSWVDVFPGLEGFYWADDGEEIKMVYAEMQGGQWVAWSPFNDENRPVTYYSKWTRSPVQPPQPDDTTEL